MTLCNMQNVMSYAAVKDQGRVFQMPTRLGTSVEDLKDAIKDEAHNDVVLLVNLWVL